MKDEPKKIELYETEGEMNHLRVDDKVAHILGDFRRSAKGYGESDKERFDRLAKRILEDEFASLEDPIFIGDHEVEPFEDWHRRNFYKEGGGYKDPMEYPILQFQAGDIMSLGG